MQRIAREMHDEREMIEGDETGSENQRDWDDERDETYEIEEIWMRVTGMGGKRDEGVRSEKKRERTGNRKMRGKRERKWEGMTMILIPNRKRVGIAHGLFVLSFSMIMFAPYSSIMT